MEYMTSYDNGKNSNSTSLKSSLMLSHAAKQSLQYDRLKSHSLTYTHRFVQQGTGIYKILSNDLTRKSEVIA